MKLTKIRIRNFRGLEAIDVEVPRAGLIAKGGNARGKTSFLKAIRSVLESRDIASDAIRIGADKSEILVDLDNVTVKRAITPKTSTLTVERDGMKASKPTAFLKELLGAAALDPLDLYLAKPKDRRELILKALPVTVTIEQLRKHAPEIPPTFDVSGHGLEVVARAHHHFYEERTLANKQAVDAARTAERLADEAKTAAKAVTPGPILPIDAARAAVTAAERALTELQTRAREAEQATARTSAERDRVEQLRTKATELEKTIGERVDVAAIEAERDRYAAQVADLEQKLEAARLLLKGATERRDRAAGDNREIEARTERVADLRSQADALAAALSAASIVAPDASAVGAAEGELTAARATLERASLQETAMKAVTAAEEAKKEAETLKNEAADLDATVKRLAKDAPNELLAAAEGIPGLTLAGDEVLLDGKSLDALSGAEQLRFAVEIARRANAKTKILVVDGLERLDSDQLDVFVAHATRDDWQLLGSLVTNGELVVAAIEPDLAAAAE